MSSRLFVESIAGNIRFKHHDSLSKSNTLLGSSKFYEVVWGVSDKYPEQKELLGFVAYGERIIPIEYVVDIDKDETGFLRQYLQSERIFGNFILAMQIGDDKTPQIKTFDTIHQVEKYIAKHCKKENEWQYFRLPRDVLLNPQEKNSACRSTPGNTFDGKDFSYTLRREPFFANPDDMFDNYFQFKDLDNTYSGLRYNGVDYECKRVLCGKNDIQGQILGFITGDGEIIDADDPLLDGVFLIEGDESKKFNDKYLIRPSEVGAPYTDADFDTIDGENANADIAERHAFGRYIVALSYYLNEQYNYSRPIIDGCFTTHNDMETFYSDECFSKNEKELRDDFLENMPKSVGYGVDARYAPELAKDKQHSFIMKDLNGDNFLGDYVSFLVGQSSLFHINKEVEKELEEFDNKNKEQDKTKIHKR